MKNLALAMIVASFFVQAAPAQAQSAMGRARLRQVSQAIDSITIPRAYQREVFTYPTQNRPDPVSPPVSIVERTEAGMSLFLRSVLYDTKNPARSVAVIRDGSSSGQQYRVSQGDKIGTITIIAIQEKKVIIGLQKLGRVVTDTLTLSRSPR